jgi:hypothetical protein
MNEYNVTPADLEFVLATDIVIGDVIVEYTPLNTDEIIPATQRQLNAKRTSYTKIESIVNATTSRNIPVLDMNGTWGRFALDCRVWRIINH